jgi:hypothetical protein
MIAPELGDAVGLVSTFAARWKNDGAAGWVGAKLLNSRGATGAGAEGRDRKGRATVAFARLTAYVPGLKVAAAETARPIDLGSTLDAAAAVNRVGAVATLVAAFEIFLTAENQPIALRLDGRFFARSTVKKPSPGPLIET